MATFPSDDASSLGGSPINAHFYLPNISSTKRSVRELSPLEIAELMILSKVLVWRLLFVSKVLRIFKWNSSPKGD
jgi:hypothetical protein